MDHYWLELPGPNWFSGAELYRQFVASASDGSVAVELGAWKGRSTACMAVEIANSGKAISFYTVDHWEGSEAEIDHQLDEDRQSGKLFEIFRNNLAPVTDYVNIVRSDTVLAADQFQDASIDFLYIDASHTYEGVLADLQAWFPKVKIGGTIAGDDWCFYDRGERSVQNAVVDFFGEAAGAVKVEPGSIPNAEWLQWSIRKTNGLALSSARALKRRRAVRKLIRMPPIRIAKALARRISRTG